jgi:flagellin-specific chaperone FliS
MMERKKAIITSAKVTTMLRLALFVVPAMQFRSSTIPSSSVGNIDVGVSAWHTRIPISFPIKTRIKVLSNSDDIDQTSDSAFPATTTNLSPNEIDDSQDLLSLREHVAKLREEANSLQLTLQRERLDKIRRETEKVDRWIEELLIEARVNENTELLKTVDQVFQRLTEDRYSAEQVHKIFKRLCEIRTQESRSNCSPLMSLLVDAAGKLDCTERTDNPNKRWNHKVERILQKKLFARDWNIDLDDEDDDSGNPWKLR